MRGDAVSERSRATIASMDTPSLGSRVVIASGGTGTVKHVAKTADGARVTVELDGGAPWKALLWPVYDASELRVIAAPPCESPTVLS